MACFTVSLIGAVGVGVARHIVKHHENKIELAGRTPEVDKFGSDTKWSTKLAYLETGLFAGSFVLAAEHMLHGEVVPYPPFLTATETAEGTMEMLHEIATVGVSMFAIVVGVWALGVFIYDLVKYRKRKGLKTKQAESK